MGERFVLIVLSLAIFMVALSSAQEYSMDISGLNKEEYSLGQDLAFIIILLEDKLQIEEQVTYTIADSLKKKEISGTATSNQETSIKIENDFTGGIWTITASYLDTEVKRTFIVGENPEIEFLIEGDELIIRNIGNVRYTKTIEIKIGDEINTYAQNIKAGDEKILKLISKDGAYDIEVTDGKTSIKRENIQLFGTGNVVGAVDRELVGYTGFASIEDIKNPGNRIGSSSKLPFSLIFVAIIGIFAALVFVERKIRSKKK